MEALAKWEQFNSIQPNATTLLVNSMSKDRIAHAYLFEGGKGTGKLKIGTLFAKAYFCLNRIELFSPCEECSNCKRIESGNHPDFHIIHPDGQSIKKDQIKQLKAEFNKTGVESNKKVYIINQADKMTVDAANTLLKFLEEPHRGTLALLLTEKKSAILSTIVSRCQTVSFIPLSASKIIDVLTDQHAISMPIARLAVQLTNDIEEALTYSKDEWFAKARQVVVKLFEVLINGREEAIVYLQTGWTQAFDLKNRENIILGIELLYILVKDLLYVKNNENNRVVFIDNITSLEKLALNFTS
ncbi:MAG: polymerase subunit delta [Bacillales bacterium]|nr:polymerase subunit delta [Bacillales bacterium]